MVFFVLLDPFYIPNAAPTLFLRHSVYISMSNIGKDPLIYSDSTYQLESLFRCPHTTRNFYIKLVNYQIFISNWRCGSNPSPYIDTYGILDHK